VTDAATIAGVPVVVCPTDGPAISSADDAVEIIGSTYGSGAEVIVIPKERLAPEFFQLRTRVAGEVVQKIQMYGFHLVVAGDVEAQLAASQALRDFVREANRGSQLWFVRDLVELEERLSARAAG
jgi:hypothetical protein